MPTIPTPELEQLCSRILQGAGADAREAEIVSQHLVDANLAGHDSHGAMRVIQYVDEIRSGLIVPGQELTILKEWPAGAVVDAAGMFGQVACCEAMQIALDKAAESGIAAVTIRGAGHSGRLGAYAEQAAAAGRLGIAMANGGGAGQWVAPFGGRERRLSTNPIAIGAPSAGPFPLILDISTSVAPEGKVRDRLQKQQTVPDGWLVDHEGQPTTDPQTLYAELCGALLPFGGTSGYKGFGLGFMVDVFAGALTAAGCPESEKAASGVRSGLFMLAVDIRQFTPLDEFRHRVARMASYVKSSRPAAGFDEVLVPGEPEYRQRQEKQRQGASLPDSVRAELDQLVLQLTSTSSEETAS